MSYNCPICSQETAPERAIRGGSRVTDYVCDNCNIIWYKDTDGKLQITVSSTHSRASKLSDDEFEKLIKKISEYQKVVG
jgi:uncharacterized Zn finger protein